MVPLQRSATNIYLVLYIPSCAQSFWRGHDPASPRWSPRCSPFEPLCRCCFRCCCRAPGGAAPEALYPYLVASGRKPQVVVVAALLAFAARQMEPASGLPLLVLFAGPLLASSRGKRVAVCALHLAAAALPHLVLAAAQYRVDAALALLVVIASDRPPPPRGLTTPKPSTFDYCPFFKTSSLLSSQNIFGSPLKLFVKTYQAYVIIPVCTYRRP